MRLFTFFSLLSYESNRLAQIITMTKASQYVTWAGHFEIKSIQVILIIIGLHFDLHLIALSARCLHGLTACIVLKVDKRPNNPAPFTLARRRASIASRSFTTDDTTLLPKWRSSGIGRRGASFNASCPAPPCGPFLELEFAFCQPTCAARRRSLAKWNNYLFVFNLLKFPIQCTTVGK